VISSIPGSDTEKQATINNLPIFPFNIGPDIAFWKIPPFQKYLKANNIEVVLCVQNRDAKIGGLAARLAGIPAIFARQGIDNIKRTIFHKIAFTKFVDGIITNTKSIKSLYESYHWFNKDFIHVVYDGLILPDQLSKIDLHKEFDLIPNSKVIIGSGRLSKQKIFDLLIEVAAMARKHKDNWSIIIAGTGKLERQLKKMVIKHQVEDMVKFIGFRNDVLTLMNSSDLFVLSSDSEGMSNALREAMAVGLPCVATNVFGVEELFKDNENGIIVKKGNVKSIYQAIESIFNNSELENQLGTNASNFIRTFFPMEKMIEHLEKIFYNRINRSS
jgi:glycosyltransferase involved in cell wall biosynthesis